MNPGSRSGRRQHGLSMIGFLFVIVIFALIAVLAMKVVPTVVEYSAIKRAVQTAKQNGQSVIEIQNAFNKSREVNYIDSVDGKDLEIVKTADGFDVSVAYEKRIPLVGPASLVLDYRASTGNTPASPKAQ
jgi:type II secretory pathway pseudopilin PulG